MLLDRNQHLWLVLIKVTQNLYFHKDTKTMERKTTTISRSDLFSNNKQNPQPCKSQPSILWFEFTLNAP